jgi:hypothetical protein
MSESGGLWANMLGIGPILATINDPAFLDQIKAFVVAVTDTQQRCARIEAKLDYLIAAEARDGRRVTAISVEQRPTGTGGHTVTGGAADDGTRADQARPVRIAGGTR